MSHQRIAAAALAALSLTATVPLAGASTELPIGQLVGDLVGNIAEAFPVAPASPGLPPLAGLERLQSSVDALFERLASARDALVGVLRFLQGEAYKLLLGLSDGDAGSNAGTPDSAGYEVSPIVVAEERVTLPSVGVDIPSENVTITTPPIRRNVTIPGLGTPPVHVELPVVRRSVDTPGVERRVVVDTPPVDVPRVAVRTPPVEVDVPRVEVPPLTVRVPPLEARVPRIETPGVNVTTPPVDTPGVNHSLDFSGASVGVQRLRGTLYLGSQSVSYDLGPYEVGASQLPPGVPRRLDVEAPAQHVPPQALLQQGPVVVTEERTIRVHDGAEIPVTKEPIVVGGQRIALNSTEVVVTEGFRALPAMRLVNLSASVQPQHVLGVEAGGGRVAVPGVGLTPPVTVPVNVPSQRVGDLTTPELNASTGEVVLHDGPVGTPGLGGSLDLPDQIDNLGYFGYGRDEDSSLYPFACGPLVGCVSSRGFLGPLVEFADCALDEAAERLDQPIVVRVPPQPQPLNPHFPCVFYAPYPEPVVPQFPALPLLPPFG